MNKTTNKVNIFNTGILQINGKAYLIISMSFYNIDVDSCPSISRLQLLGALGLLDAL